MKKLRPPCLTGEKRVVINEDTITPYLDEDETVFITVGL